MVKDSLAKNVQGEERFLVENLQANILKPHGRDYVAYLLCRFNSDASLIGEFLEVFRTQEYLFSYYEQLEETVKYLRHKRTDRQSDAPTGYPVCNFGFSRHFYNKLRSLPDRENASFFPVDPYFLSGIENVGDELPFYMEDLQETYAHRPDQNGFEKEKITVTPYDMIIGLAHDNQNDLTSAVNRLRQLEAFSKALVGGTIPGKNLVIEYGFGKNAAHGGDKGFKPLGYEDGLSETRSREEIAALTLRPERESSRGGDTRRSRYPYGTYMYFQKIGLDDKAFKRNIEAVKKEAEKAVVEAHNKGGFSETWVEQLRGSLLEKAVQEPTDPRQQSTSDIIARIRASLSQDDISQLEAAINKGVVENQTDSTEESINKAYIKALLMGRFPEGTPLVLSKVEEPYAGFMPFDYANDPEGWACPFQAHVRRMNPRQNGFANAKIVRRGSYYFGNADSYEEEESDGTGLLFVSLQRSLTEQLLPILRRMGVKGYEDPIAYSKDSLFNFQLSGYQIEDLPDAERLPVQLEKVAHYLGGDFFYLPSLFALKEYTVKFLEASKGD